MDATDVAMAAGAALASIACEVSVWRRPGSLRYRLFWGVIALVPFAGPLLCVTAKNNPEPHGEREGEYWKPDGPAP
ncbi:MAG TPA: hypothetical protein VMB50_18815 [Myxococcales bacterium]|nr:hypothetical protein [Myxococcales bacterium]